MTKNASNIPENLYNAILSRFRDDVLEYAEDIRVFDRKSREFWLNMRTIYGKEPFYKKLYDKISYHFKKCKKKKSNERIQHIGAMGYIPLVHEVEVVSGANKTLFIPGRSSSLLYSDTEAIENNDFITTIPYSVLGSYDDLELSLRLIDVNMRLREYFTMHPTNETLTHHGASLGYTALSGGYYGRKIEEISGSYHANQNLIHDPDLQRDVIEVCCLVVTTTFGKCDWFIKLMEYYELPENHAKKNTFSLVHHAPTFGGLVMHVQRRDTSMGMLTVLRSYFAPIAILEEQLFFNTAR